MTAKLDIRENSHTINNAVREILQASTPGSNIPEIGSIAWTERLLLELDDPHRAPLVLPVLPKSVARVFGLFKMIARIKDDDFGQDACGSGWRWGRKDGGDPSFGGVL